MSPAFANRLSRLLLFPAALMIFSAGPARAEPLPSMTEVLASEDEAVVSEIATILTKPSEDLEVQLSMLDGLLPRLNRPTLMRGLVQYMRGGVLLQNQQYAPARQALEESIRLLPGYSAPLLGASVVEAYADQPGRAIDYLIRASRIDPQIVSQFPDYELQNILHRIRGEEHRRQLRRLAERLFEIGWQGNSLTIRASLAEAVIEASMEDGDLAGATRMLPHLVTPTVVRRLLMQNAYREFWPSLEEWAGPRQERLWPIYLNELKYRWTASHDPEQGRAYIGALTLANRPNQIVTEFMPLFEEPDRERDYHLLWVAPALADALVQLGRWDEMESLFARALEVWPVGEDVNALNLLANRGRSRYRRGDFEGAISDLRLALADGGVATGEVSANATNAIHHYLACALHQLGRHGEALDSITRLRADGSPMAAVDLLLCQGRLEEARTVLLMALELDSRREEVIAFVQLEKSPPAPSEHSRMLRERRNQLARDPALLAEVEKYGRVLPYPASAGAPTIEDEARPTPL